MDLKKRDQSESKIFEDRVVKISRVTKVVTGGRRFSLSVFVVVGDCSGNLGYGLGKSKEVPQAIRKAIKNAKKNFCSVFLKGSTIPYSVEANFCSAKILLKPAPKGTGIIAGAAVRAVMEVAGIHDIVSKSLGSDNQVNIVKATFKALLSLRDKREVDLLRKGSE